MVGRRSETIDSKCFLSWDVIERWHLLRIYQLSRNEDHLPLDRRFVQQLEPAKLGQIKHSVPAGTKQRLPRRYFYSFPLYQFFHLFNKQRQNEGIWLPRNESKLVGGGGAGLSSPRLISTRFTKSSGTITGYTLMLMSWGQLITHDITRAPTFTSGIKSF